MRRSFVPKLLVLTLLAALCAIPLKSLETPRVSIQALAFLSGRWTEESADGVGEEYWSQPMGSSMVGTYRVVKDGNAVF